MNLVRSSFPLCYGGGEARKRQHFSAPSGPVFEKKKQGKCWRKGKTCFSDVLGKSKLIYTNVRSSCPQLEDWDPVVVMGFSTAPLSLETVWEKEAQSPVWWWWPCRCPSRTATGWPFPFLLHVDIWRTKPKAAIKSISWNTLFSNFSSKSWVCI